MIKFTPKQQKIIAIILKKGTIQSSGVHAEMLAMGEKAALVTIKRALTELLVMGVLSTSGSGRSVSYEISVKGRIFAEVDAEKYCAIEPDNRYGLSNFNFSLLPAMAQEDLLMEDELKFLNNSTRVYQNRIKDLPPAIQKKELERLIIELSWKSSKIEGNTYTLLDTEKLILENKEAPGHDHKEARMILNHKDAFNFIRDNAREFNSLTNSNLEALHAILVKGLSVGFGLRQKPVGVVGSIYRPLDNIHQIKEAVSVLAATILKITDPCLKSLIALLGISYIQPFEDGNKRTARLMANALLLAHNRAPLSYRSVEEKDYREAMLVFYELNSIIPFKKIFLGQYDFAAHTYAVK